MRCVTTVPLLGPNPRKSSNSIFPFLRDELVNRHVCTALQKDDRKRKKKRTEETGRTGAVDEVG